MVHPCIYSESNIICSTDLGWHLDIAGELKLDDDKGSFQSKPFYDMMILLLIHDYLPLKQLLVSLLELLIIEVNVLA